MNNSKEKPEDLSEILIVESIELFADFFPKIYLLESTLKARLYEHLKARLGNDWFSIQLEKRPPLFEEEIRFIMRRKPEGFILNGERLMLESGLGFWVEFFNKEQYKSVQGLPIQIFENLPAQVKRKDIYLKLNSLKEFRNNLFHSRVAPFLKPSDILQLEEMRALALNFEMILGWFGGLPKRLIDSGGLIVRIDQVVLRLQKSQ